MVYQKNSPKVRVLRRRTVRWRSFAASKTQPQRYLKSPPYNPSHTLRPTEFSRCGLNKMLVNQTAGKQRFWRSETQRAASNLPNIFCLNSAPTMQPDDSAFLLHAIPMSLHYSVVKTASCLQHGLYSEIQTAFIVSCCLIVIPH